MQKDLRNQPRRLKQQGFTLIELLIVVAIIGILAAVGVPQYGNYLDRSAVAGCQSELSSFRGLALSESAFEGSTDYSVYGDIDFDFSSCATVDGDSLTGANPDFSDLADAFVLGVDADDDDLSVTIATNRANADEITVANGQITVNSDG